MCEQGKVRKGRVKLSRRGFLAMAASVAALRAVPGVLRGNSQPAADWTEPEIVTDIAAPNERFNRTVELMEMYFRTNHGIYMLTVIGGVELITRKVDSMPNIYWSPFLYAPKQEAKP